MSKTKFRLRWPVHYYPATSDFFLHIRSALHTMPDGAKAYCFTVNNYRSLLDPLLWPDCVFCIYQEEVGDKLTPHLQGYVAFSVRVTMVKLHTYAGLARARFESARGSGPENVIYCTKAEGRLGGPYEFGDVNLCPSPGSRSDLKLVASDIRAGHGLKRIAEDHPSHFIRYHSGISKMVTMFAPRRKELTICLVLFGSGGAGKTTLAGCLARCLAGDVSSSDAGRAPPDPYYVPEQKGSGLYFDGYQQRSVVIIEEFKGNRMTPTFFNQLIDAKPFQVPIHGGVTEFDSKYVIITTNVYPSQWWPNVVYMASLQRRIVIFGTMHNKHRYSKSKSDVYYDARTGVFTSSSKRLRVLPPANAGLREHCDSFSPVAPAPPLVEVCAPLVAPCPLFEYSYFNLPFEQEIL